MSSPSPWPEDMKPFHFQVRSVVHHSLGAIEGLRRGHFAPPTPDPPYSWHGLRDRVADALARISAVTSEELDQLSRRDVLFVAGDRRRLFTAEEFVLSWSVPNLHFHAATTYDMLRLKGVPLGKRDYPRASPRTEPRHRLATSADHIVRAPPSSRRGSPVPSRRARGPARPASGRDRSARSRPEPARSASRVRDTRPSRSRLRRVRLSMRCEMPSMRRFSSLKRTGPAPSIITMSMLHLSPTRASTGATVVQHRATAPPAEPRGRSLGSMAVTCVCPGSRLVRSCDAVRGDASSPGYTS